MKKIFILLTAFLLLSTGALAQNWPGLKNTLPFATLTTLVTATTTTGVTGSLVTLGIPFSDITCVVTNPTGSTPTDVVTKIYGSIDGTNMATLVTTTSNTFPATFTTRSATAVPVMFMQGAYVSKATGTASAIQLDCIASH